MARRTATTRQVAQPVQASSDSTWRTPRWLRERLRVLYGGPPELDPATSPDNPLGALTYWCGPDPAASPRVGALFGEPEIAPVALDGLTQPWGQRAWFLNPPFKGLEDEWLPKVVDVLTVEGVTRGGVLVMPCNRFETDAYHAVMRLAPLRYYPQEPGTEHRSNRRVKFERPDGSVGKGTSPYATVLLGFFWPEERWVEAFDGFGYMEVARELRRSA